jgi:hypothetical protein
MAKRLPHKAAHPECPHNARTWGDCDKAEQEARGRCASLVRDGEGECRNWGTDPHADRWWCGQHIASILLAEDKARREAARKARLDSDIDVHMAWTAEHPSVWDVRPVGWKPGDNSPRT